MAFKESKFLSSPEFLSAAAGHSSLDFMKPFEMRHSDPCFPAEFLYDLAEGDEEVYLAGFARRLAQNQFKTWLHSGSTESNLGRVTGSTTPLGAKSDSLDLLLQAAGQIARLKMDAGEEPLMGHRLPRHRTFAQIPPAINPHNFRASHGYIEPHQFQTRAARAMLGGVGALGENGRCPRAVMGVSGNAAAFRSLHFQPVMPFGGGGMKKERAGTGVFLPNHHPKDSGGKTEMLLAGRNAAMVAQQRRNFIPEIPLSHEIRLPQEWTY